MAIIQNISREGVSVGRLKITDVFRPGGIPSYTYVNRTSDKHAASSTYEEKLKRALKRTGNLIYISGGSKTGKSPWCCTLDMRSIGKRIYI